MSTDREKQIFEVLQHKISKDRSRSDEVFLQSLSEAAKSEIFEMSLKGEVVFAQLSEATKRELEPANNTKKTRNER